MKKTSSCVDCDPIVGYMQADAERREREDRENDIATWLPKVRAVTDGMRLLHPVFRAVTFRHYVEQTYVRPWAIDVKLLIRTRVPDRDAPSLDIPEGTDPDTIRRAYDGIAKRIDHGSAMMLTLDDLKKRFDLVRERLQMWTYDALRRAVCHELDEMFLIDGKRAREPHA